MAWQRKREYLDLQTGMHVLTLHDPESGAEHKLQIMTGHDFESCHHCGHVKPKTNLDELDVQGLIAAEIESLNKSHANQTAYAKKHRVPIKAAKK